MIDFIATKKYPLHYTLKQVLNSIYGVGKGRFRYYLRRLSISGKVSLQNLDSRYVRAVDSLVLPIVGLERCIKRNLSFVFSCGNYKSKRMRLGLPRNGQRTRSNAQTTRRFKKLKRNLF